MWKKLLLNRIWKRIYIERLGEPLIYNLVSIFIFIFGNFIKKIEYDLVPRQPYAFGLNEVFKIAKLENKKKNTNTRIWCCVWCRFVQSCIYI